MATVHSRDLEEQAAPQDASSPLAAADGESASSDGESASSSAGGPARKQPGCLGALRGILTPAQRVYCVFALLVELLLVWLWQEDVTLSPAEDVPIYTIAHLMLVSLYPRDATPPVSAAAEHQRPAGAATAVGGGKARAFFLDGVKILCTELVLIHHISIGFGGEGGLGWVFKLGQYQGNTFGELATVWLLTPNQSFFMCTLFFVGGIFTPSSLERKGVTEFVRDKLKRLGWPLVVSYFVVSPLSSGLRGVLLGGGDMLSYMKFDQNVVWFLASLLIFNVSYVVLPLPQVSVPMPSAAQVILTCAAIGAVQGWIMYCNFTLLNVGPQFQGGLPFDVAFFSAGCVAKRSGWLEGIQSMAPGDFWLARLAAVVTVVGAGVCMVSGLFVPSPTPSPMSAVLVGVWLGVMTGGISVSVLHLFAAHCNRSCRLQKLASDSQYAVYVLQAVVIPCVMLTLLPILRAAGYEVEFWYSDGTFGSSTELPQWVIVCGWLYTVVLVTVISWPLGHFFRKLPLVRDVL